MKEYLDIIDEVIRNGKYKDTWESLQQYQVPEWYKNAKFGIFIHWGVYSVPAYGNEWYPKHMYEQGSKEYNHHIETYGKHIDFGYKDFIPMFKAEKFNADEWLDLIESSGAQYMIPVAEHHDGFQMYKSDISKWNSYEMGPKRDVLGELFMSAKKHNIINGASSHRIEHWFFMGHGKEFESDVTDNEKRGDFYWPAAEESEHHDIFSKPIPTQEFLEDWLVRCCEIVDKYKPKIIYFDWWIQHSSVKPYLKKFAAYYYNRAEEWGEEVVINYKHDAFMFGTAVIDIERGQFADVKPFVWQTDTTVSKNSWCYTENNSYKKACDIVCDLVDIVSKNGRLLLNIGPKSDGTIPDGDKKVLTDIGRWLKINGEAIYGAKVWKYSAEGPTKIREGQFTDEVEKNYSSQDIRFTVNNGCIYVFVLKYPLNGEVNVINLKQADAKSLPLFSGIIKDISVLGFDEKVKYTRDETALHLKTENVKSDFPVVFKINVD